MKITKKTQYLWYFYCIFAWRKIFSVFKKFLFKYTLMHTENSCKSLESKFYILLCTLVSMQVCDKIPLGHNPPGQNPPNLKVGQNPLIIIIGGFCPMGFLSQGDFVPGGFCQRDFVTGGFCHRGVLSVHPTGENRTKANF